MEARDYANRTYLSAIEAAQTVNTFRDGGNTRWHGKA